MTEARELLIRGAHVLTMDPARGDLPRGDVHVKDGIIAAVGEALDAPGAEVLDGTAMLVLPGLVDTHWHLWTTLLRGMAGSTPERGYFPVSRGIGAHYTPDDSYLSGSLACTEALDSGITFVHDWCHNVRSPAHADAALRALSDSGIRARFSYGIPTGQANDAPIDVADLGRLHRDWDGYSAGGRLSLGLAWRGRVSAASLADHTAARALGLPVSVHVNNFRSSAGGIAALADSGLLGPHVQLIHAIWSTDAEVAAVAASGASLSLSPFTEMRIGFGMPMTNEYLAAGVPIGLSVDTPALAGNADMFAIMKVVQNVANARAGDEFELSARRVLALATLEGARSLGMDAAIGSVTPGKRADLVMLDTRHLNLAGAGDPAELVVSAARPSNVDTVIVDGRVRKHGGKLVGVDAGALAAEARVAAIDVRRRAGWA